MADQPRGFMDAAGTRRQRITDRIVVKREAAVIYESTCSEKLCLLLRK